MLKSNFICGGSKFASSTLRAIEIDGKLALIARDLKTLNQASEAERWSK